MKLEVGMYVRTDKGEIKRIFQYNEQEDNLVWCTLNCYATTKGSIIKASHNIIDLIEVGDYVNGCRVIAVNISEIVGHYSYVKCINDNVFKENEIETIVTREQFSAMEYRLGGK